MFDMTFSQSVRASDNLDVEDPAVSGVRSVTSLNGTVSSITRSQSFILDFSVGAELDNDGFELGNTGVDATYIRQSQTSELELDARYFQRQIRSEFQDEDDLETIIGSGTQVDYGYGGRLLFGRQGPLSVEVSASQAFREFDSADPDAVNSTTTKGGVVATARPDRETSIRGSLNFDEREEFDATNQVKATTTAGLGVSRDLANATTVSADVNWTRIATTETVMAVRSTEEVSGIGARLAFDRDLPNGSVSASVERTITEDGTVDELRVGRSIEFPASSLFVEAGLILNDGTNLSPLVGLNYQRDLRDGAISIDLSQTGGLNGDDQATVSTSGSASYRRDINAISSLTATVGVRNDSVIGMNDTTRRIDGSLSYRRQLTDTASLNTGFEHARIFETGTDERVSNTLFVTFTRDFSARR